MYVMEIIDINFMYYKCIIIASKCIYLIPFIYSSLIELLEALWLGGFGVGQNLVFDLGLPTGWFCELGQAT